MWCSVDLRDGNQALIEPMDAERKLRMFMPAGRRWATRKSRSVSRRRRRPIIDFVRKLIEEDLIPDDVTVQVLTQAREPLIRSTFESLRGRQARDHALSTIRRRPRSGASCSASTAPGIRRHRRRRGARVVRDCARAQADDRLGLPVLAGELYRQPSSTFAVEICDAVSAVWQPTPAATR